jgi:hypothetical protein
MALCRRSKQVHISLTVAFREDRFGSCIDEARH